MGSGTLSSDSTTRATGSPAAHQIWRFEVRASTPDHDPIGRSVLRKARWLGLLPKSVRTTRVYFVQGLEDRPAAERIRDQLLRDPVLEVGTIGVVSPDPSHLVVEVHPLPGVMDPAGLTVGHAIEELVGVQGVRVSTGWRYDIEGLDRKEAETLARKVLANTVIEAIHFEPFVPERFPSLAPADQRVIQVPITRLSDSQLESMSRDKHLFLSLEEMRAIQAEYRRLQREPTDVELETLAQTWSEHCVHKTLKSTIRYQSANSSDSSRSDVIRWKHRPGHTIEPDGTVVIHNLLKSTVAAATHELIAEGVDWTLSVFKDNAGVIALDDEWAVNIKVETHNHPSAIEPYGGAATGVGGCIRDVIATGLGARPIANTDVFCVAPPDTSEIPAGCLHPRRVLERVVDGVRDYGNRMGIPTVNGAVWFDQRYIGNPLVYCGCVGLLPRHLVQGAAVDGDLIVAIGGRTGRDGIHGATFSSAELTDAHADEFSHAVQIGNAIEEKRMLDAILRARDVRGGPLYHAMTDCGAGGFSSAVGEMGSRIGADVHLDRAPLKYQGLRYDEIWISESQERMILAVPRKHLAALGAICREEGVELAELGTFGLRDSDGSPILTLKYKDETVGSLSMTFLHDGIPMPTRDACWKSPAVKSSAASENGRQRDSDSFDGIDVASALCSLLAHPNIASKRWIVRQYDHEVQGNTIIKPLIGERGNGPGDASVLEPVAGSGRGIAIGCGLATQFGHPQVNGSDPYLMALAAIDECVRNLVCVGADPDRIAILDNFCWPSCGRPENLGSLVRAAEGCYDGAKAYRTPFVSGKDSLNNQFRTDDGRVIEIPPTLLITGVGIVENIDQCITMDAKVDSEEGRPLLLIGAPSQQMAGSHLELVQRRHFNSGVPRVDLRIGPASARIVAALIADGLILAAHDCSEGGLLVALAEMCIAGGNSTAVGAELYCEAAYNHDAIHPIAELFNEAPSRYLLEIRGGQKELKAAEKRCAKAGVLCRHIGFSTTSGRLKVFAQPSRGMICDIETSKLSEAFLKPLDW